MTPEILVAMLGAILSLIFAYFPWVKEWFDKLDPVYKPLLNAGLLLLLVAILFGLSCAGLVSYFVCSVDGALAALELWFLALVGNQLAYQVLVRQPKQK